MEGVKLERLFTAWDPSVRALAASDAVRNHVLALARLKAPL